MMKKLPSQIIAEKLDGQKTYIVAFLIILVGILTEIGIIATEQLQEIIIVLSGLLVVALRSAIKKCEVDKR